MSRLLLDGARVYSNIQPKLGGNYDETINEVEQAALNNNLLVVGMAQNPFCKKVRKQLDNAGVEFHYLEYGSYLKDWQRRLALKMWSGWSTFPMVFVKGELIGGNAEVKELLISGELNELLADVGEESLA